ncbi:MAG: hypothetical protein WCG25_01935 [bacterium]
MYVCLFSNFKFIDAQSCKRSCLSSSSTCLNKIHTPHCLSRCFVRGNNLSTYATALAVTTSNCLSL